MSRFTDFTGCVLLIITSLLAGVESTDQCLLNSKVLSCFSGVIISIRSFFLLSYLCSLLESVLGLVSTIPFPLGLISGLSFSPSRLIFKLVPILKLGNDTNILLLGRHQANLCFHFAGSGEKFAGHCKVT